MFYHILRLRWLRQRGMGAKVNMLTNETEREQENRPTLKRTLALPQGVSDTGSMELTTWKENFIMILLRLISKMQPQADYRG